MTAVKNYSYQVAVAANQNIKERDYWLRKLSGFSEKTGILPDYKKEPGRAPVVVSYEFSLTGELFSRLMALSKGMDHTLHIVLTAGLMALLYKYSRSSDIAIGSPIYKQDEDIEFINTVLVLRNCLTGDMSFKDLLLQVKQTVLEAAENQNYPIYVLHERLDISCPEGEDPFFDVALLLENIHHKKYIQDAGHNILFSFLRNPGSIEAVIEYDSNRYCEETIRRFQQHFSHVMETAAADVQVKLAGIDLLSEAEKKQILLDFNDTDMAYSHEETVCRLFARQVEKTPDNIALTAQETVPNTSTTPIQLTLTYRELYKRIAKLAHLLQAKGIRSDAIAAVMLPPSAGMIVSLLAALQAEGAYLPIAPEYPPDRIAYMLADSRARLLLTTESLLKETGKFSNLQIETLFIEEDGYIHPDSDAQDECPVPVEPQHPAYLEHLAYIIYTSGSTGKPKGVLVQHNNLLANLFAFLAEFDVESNDTVIQLSDYTFDAFAEELYPPLLRGGKLAIPGLYEYLDIQKLAEFIIKHKVSIVDCSPLLLNELNKIDSLKNIRLFISGGDVLRQSYIDRLAKIGQVYNTYGPTETTVCAAYYHYQGEIAAPIPIGKPIANYKIYILDEYLKLLPIGVVGEIAIHGPGVTRGYLNRPDLTAERFVQGAFFEKIAPCTPKKALNKSHESRCLPLTTHHSLLTNYFFLTGDLGRWLANGAVEFFGRKDRQVKIRGFRIETGEIETLLLKIPGITGAAVAARQGKDGEKYLCAYFTAGNSQDQTANKLPDAAEIRMFLARNLPDFMIPAFFVQLEKLPLTNSGKIDLNALPEPQVKTSVEYVAPRNEIEKQLQEIWQQVLELEHIGVLDNFFEIGGHSLKATVMISKIRQAFNVTLPLTEIFSSPTIDQVARYIQTAAGPSPAIEVAPDENLVLLKKGNSPGHNLFLIHGGSGKVEIYTEFCTLLNPRLNCWGIQADRLENYTPRNLTIETIAHKYIGKIKRIQPQGPYHIAGWCIGGTIAYEMAGRLEHTGDSVAFLGLIDSPPPAPETAPTIPDFTYESELQDILRGFEDELLKAELKKAEELKDLWQIVATHLENHEYTLAQFRKYIPPYIAAGIPNIEQLDLKEVIHECNAIRTFTRARDIYIPMQKIDTDTHYFGAHESPIEGKENWNAYSSRPCKFYNVPGGHFSMFDTPNSAAFARLFDSLLPT